MANEHGKERISLWKKLTHSLGATRGGLVVETVRDAITVMVMQFIFVCLELFCKTILLIVDVKEEKYVQLRSFLGYFLEGMLVCGLLSLFAVSLLRTIRIIQRNKWSARKEGQP